MAFTKATPFPYQISPLSNITPFTYRDGQTYLSTLEGLKKWLNETLVPEFNLGIDNAINEFQAGIANAESRIVETEQMHIELVSSALQSVSNSLTTHTTFVNEETAAARQYVDDSIQFINNKTGQAQIERVTLDSPYTLNINPLWPNNHPIDVVLTQDNIGGHSLTLGENVSGFVDFNTEPGAVTEFSLVPQGDGTWKVLHVADGVSLNSRSHLIVGKNNSVVDRIALQKAVTKAAQANAPLSIRGTFALTGGTIVVPSSLHIDANGAVFNQLDSLTTTFGLPADSSFTGGKIVGKGTDWVNTSVVYGAAGIRLESPTSHNVTIQNVVIENMAGAGIYTAFPLSGLKIIDCRISGVGSAIIPAIDGQFSGAITFNTDDVSKFTIRGGIYKGFAQGIVTGSVEDFHISNVDISAAGQHGLYLAAVTRGTITGIRINGVPLQGMKAQIKNSEAVHSELFTIGDSTIHNCGSHAILLTNVDAAPIYYNRKVTIHDIVIEHATGGTGDSISLLGVKDVTISNIYSRGGNRGVRANKADRINIHNCNFTEYLRTGMNLFDVTEVDINNNRFHDGSVLNDVAEEFGIMIGGVSSDIRFMNNRFTDTKGNTKYAIYIAGGTPETMSFSQNTATGITDYGYRANSTVAVKLWIGNELVGNLGEFFSMPTNAGPIADTSGAALAALETEVNKLKARLRSAGMIA